METYETLLNRFDGALIEKELLNDEIKDIKNTLIECDLNEQSKNKS